MRETDLNKQRDVSDEAAARDGATSTGSTRESIAGAGGMPVSRAEALRDPFAGRAPLVSLRDLYRCGRLLED